jgi:type I restriction enzyme, S subunit
MTSNQPVDWEEIQLGELFTAHYGKSLTQKNRVPGKYKVYGSSGITGTHNEFLVKGPGLIIGRKGTIGNVYYEKNSFYPIDTTYYVKESNRYDLLFLYYKLKTLDLDKMNTHSAVPGLNREQLYSIKTKFPKITEQKAIANILSTLDEKIETNNQINEKLEEMAQALFKHWFVDFEFPNENGEPYKSSGGEMIESELGMIPKGWEALYLNQVVEVKYGRNLPTKDLTDSGYPVFGGNGLIGFYTKYLYKDPQVLIACRGAASGKVLLSLPFSFVTNNSLILENNQKIVSFEYLSQFCLFYEFYNFVTGSAQPQITINNLNKAKILIPNKKLHDEYTNVISALNTKILKLKKETEILKQIRDTLLPKLMSGEIRIPMEDGVLSEKN